MAVKVFHCTGCGTHIGDARYDTLAKCPPCGAAYKTERWQKQKAGNVNWPNSNLYCSHCGEYRTDETTYSRPGRTCKICSIRNARRIVEEDPDARRAYEKEYRLRVQKELFDAYGGRCECCGETDYTFLTIHHRFHDGSQERRVLNKVGAGFYSWLKSQGYPKERYAALCMNCNCAESWADYCPHKEPRRKAFIEAAKEVLFA